MSDLAELFSRDPLSYTQDDIREIIKFMRTKRAQYRLGDMKAGSTKPPSDKQKALLSVRDSLGDLDL